MARNEKNATACAYIERPVPRSSRRILRQSVTAGASEGGNLLLSEELYGVSCGRCFLLQILYSVAAPVADPQIEMRAVASVHSTETLLHKPLLGTERAAARQNHTHTHTAQ